MSGKILPDGGNGLPELQGDRVGHGCMGAAPAFGPWLAERERMDLWLSSLPATLGPFLDPVAGGIVVGGTLLAMLLRSPWGDVVRGVSALRILFRRSFDAAPLLAQVAAFQRIARRHGLIRLDRSVIRDADVAAAVAELVDGAPPQAIEALLRERLAARIERHRAAADLWSGAAEAAPAMGMVGTLVGLVRMFLTMTDPAAIGGGMALALLSTLYGALLANLVMMPIAARLRRYARAEAVERARLEAPLTELAAVEPSHGWQREAAA